MVHKITKSKYRGTRKRTLLTREIRLEYAQKVKYFQTLSNCMSNGSKNIHKYSAFHISLLNFVNLNYFNKVTFRRKFWFSLHIKNSNGCFF